MTPGDVAVANNGAKKGRAFTVLSVRVNTVGVCLTDCDGSYLELQGGRPPKPDRSLRCWTPMGWRSRSETRCGTRTETMLIVDGFGGIEDGETIVNVHIIRGATQWSAVRSLSLTHTRPDSWERLEEDATMSPWSYCDRYGLVVDRSDGEFAPTNETFALDLIRRAKALSEGGGMR